MSNGLVKKVGRLMLACCMAVCGGLSFAQTGPSTLPTAPKRDTSLNKSNTNKWKDEEAKLTYEKLNSAKVYRPDTAIHNFHRSPFVQPWNRDMGNLGSPVNNMLFTPEYRVGPTLGYHVFDVYRFDIEQLNFYTTSRPYSVFNYQLGSRLEQTVGLLHTQNIKPNWNISADYRKTNSPGFYKTQRNNHDNAAITTNFKSLDRHYTLYAGIVYNKEQHDENGGVVNDSDLSNAIYGDRRTITTAYQNEQYSQTRSTVTNMQRDFTFLLQHSYTWGRTDTAYNKDSTQYSYKLAPRFSISHTTEISTEKHVYKDLSPDSLRYVGLFNQSFSGSGSYYVVGRDSVIAQQKWFWADNKVMLNGFIGKEGRQLKFSAGAGIRFDQFIAQPVANLIQDSLPKQLYTLGLDRTKILSNYLAGEIKKEALSPGQWEYEAATRFYLTGDNAGNFTLDGLLGKYLKKIEGRFVAGFGQQLGSAPYNYTSYENNYTKLFYKFDKESITTLYASVESPRLRLYGGVKNIVLNNYIYINEKETPAQYTIPINLTQAWIRKVFRVGSFFLDNELVYQQLPDNAPINVPMVMGKEQLSFERALFKNAIKIVIGVEARYNTAYHVPGYDALLNRFYYQDSKSISNTPELAAFFNFRIKRFRAFIMADQVQQMFATNAILYTGTPVLNFAGSGNAYTPVYATPDFTIRFGFNWVMVN